MAEARRLLCIYQHAPTPGAPGFYRHRTYFAELVRRGWHVDLVSCPVDYLTGSAPGRYGRRLYLDETIDGIRHHWAWGVGRIHESRRRRAANYVSFAVTGTLRAGLLRRPDVVWASSPPLSIGTAGALLAARYRRPWIFEIRDLWPESAASVGWLDRGSTAYRMLERLARRYATRADHVIVPTPGLEQLARGHGARHVDVLPGIVADSDPGEEVRRATRDELGIAPTDLLAAYVGAHGVANGLDVVLDAAKLLGAAAGIRILLVGDGSDRARLERRISEERIEAIRLLGPVPKARVPELLSAADVCLHALREDPLFEGALPTKMLEYFGAHRAVLTTVQGLPRRLAEESGGGFAGTAAALATELRRWAALEPEERRRRGEQGFAYGLARFGLEGNVDLLESILLGITERGPGPEAVA